MKKEIEFKGHPPGAWYLISTVMWEFFSYYGMRALLVLYLSQKLLFTDDHAFNLYGAYTAIIYVTPIIGGFIADKLLGYRWSVYLGGGIIALGHFILASSDAALYLGLACVVVGVGFFKTNAISLLGEFYHHDRAHRLSAYNFYYAGGNIGAFIAGIACGYVAYKFGWHYGFILAGIGMVIGLILMFIGRRHFIGKGDHRILTKHQRPLKWFFFPGLLVLIGLTVLIIYQLIAGWVLIAVGITAIFYIAKIHKQCEHKTRSELTLFYVLTIISTIFWSFDQQGGSSFSLFISRNVNRMLDLGIFEYRIPTPMFQSINPLIILIGAPFAALLWVKLGKKKIHISSILKVGVGIILITAGFSFMTYGAKLATVAGKVNMVWVVVGMMLIGIAELFMDPVILAFVSRIAPKRSISIMVGVYYLFCGAIANYCAAQIAKLTAISPKILGTLKEHAHAYETVYLKITYISLGLLILLILFRIIFRKLSVK